MNAFDVVCDKKNRKKVALAIAGTSVLSAGSAFFISKYGINPFEWHADIDFTMANVSAAGVKLFTAPLYRYGVVAYMEKIAKSSTVDYVAKGLERIVDADMSKFSSSLVLLSVSVGYKLAEYGLLRGFQAENAEDLLVTSLACSLGVAALGPIMRDERSVKVQIKDAYDSAKHRTKVLYAKTQNYSKK